MCPNAGRCRQCDREGDRAAGAPPADDARARMGGTAVTGSLVVATTLDEAVRELADGAHAVAGGTDLVVGARQGKAPLPESIVAIHRLEELRRLEEEDGGLRIGAL